MQLKLFEIKFHVWQLAALQTKPTDVYVSLAAKQKKKK